MLKPENTLDYEKLFESLTNSYRPRQRYITTREAALVLGIHQRTVRKWITASRIKAWDIGDKRVKYIVLVKD